jgi:alkanesulfonate monooxygenase SsuD/methylene tetrahydromethanopterin reductase-like flavin-dependent oxidoreductase (luciferase family)
MRETTPLLRQLWAGDCEHQGEFYSFPSTTSAPKPLQKDGPPIWIAARDPNSHEFGVHNGFNIQVTPLWNGIEEIETLMSRFNAACESYSGPRPKSMLLHHSYVAANKDEADQAAVTLSRYFNYFSAWFQNKRPVSQGLIEELSNADIAANKMMAAENLRRDLTIGTAQEVIDRIKLYEDLGYDEFSYWIDSGMRTEQKRASLARFIDDVMPAFA